MSERKNVKQEFSSQAHYVLSAQDYLNEIFPDKWIDCGSVICNPPPSNGPQEVRTLTLVITCDNYPSGYVKDIHSSMVFGKNM